MEQLHCRQLHCGSCLLTHQPTTPCPRAHPLTQPPLCLPFLQVCLWALYQSAGQWPYASRCLPGAGMAPRMRQHQACLSSMLALA